MLIIKKDNICDRKWGDENHHYSEEGIGYEVMKITIIFKKGHKTYMPRPYSGSSNNQTQLVSVTGHGNSWSTKNPVSFVFSNW